MPPPTTFRPTHILAGHTDTVYAVAFGAEGKTAVTGSFDKSLKLWDLSTGKETKTLPGHQGLVLSVDVAADGAQIVSGGSDNRARLWDPKTGQQTRELNHPDLVDAVAISPDGTKLATGCHDGQLRIWDLTKKDSQPKAIPAHNKPQPTAIYAVAWHPSGKTVATASFDRTVRFWDVEKGTMVKELPAGFDRVTVDPKLAKPVPALVGGPAAWYATAPPDPGHRDQVFAVAFDKPGDRVATGSSDRTAKVWTVATGDLVRTFTAPDRTDGSSHPGHVTGVRFTPDGRFVVTAGPAPKNSGIVCVWNTEDGKLVARVDLPAGTVHGLAISPDGTSLLLGCGPRVRGGSAADAVVLPVPK
jgi:WD40 repeat protein